MSLQMNSSLVKFENVHRTDAFLVASEVLDFLLPLSHDYPQIAGWFKDKVVPGLLNDTRHIFRIERDGRLVAVGIAKRDAVEKKICTVRISPNYENRGLGVRVFDNLLRWLDTDQPHLTVSEHKLQVFERIFDWYGFELTSSHPSIYVYQRRELFYNEKSSACVKA